MHKKLHVMYHTVRECQEFKLLDENIIVYKEQKVIVFHRCIKQCPRGPIEMC